MSAHLRIDLGALRANYALFQQAAALGERTAALGERTAALGECAAAPGRSGAVVKADGYGLGAAPVAQALADAGCREFFVATAAEALALRGTLPDATIYVFEGALADTAAELRRWGVVPVLNHVGQAELWRRQGAGAPAAVHVDTGMHRLGFPPAELPAAAAGLNVRLLVTHLACADEPGHPMNQRQLERFDGVRRSFPGVPVSIGNSAGVLNGWAGDVGRPGIGLFGGNPFLRAPSPVRPVVTLEGRILQIREIAAGESIGYGATFTAPRPLRVAIVGLGYGDGLPRLLSNRGEAALHGRRCPIVGRVSMDLTAVDVTDGRADLDDWVEFLGAGVGVDEVAGWAQTIAYEVLTGLSPRPRREWLAG